MIIVAVVCRVCRVCVVCRLRGECRRSLSVLLQFYLRGECRRSLSVLLQFHLRGECRRSLSVLLHLRRRPLGRLLRKCRSDAVDDDLTLREYRRVQEMGALGLLSSFCAVSEAWYTSTFYQLTRLHVMPRIRAPLEYPH
jgi:hypothetical protein